MIFVLDLWRGKIWIFPSLLLWERAQAPEADEPKFKFQLNDLGQIHLTWHWLHLLAFLILSIFLKLLSNISVWYLRQIRDVFSKHSFNVYDKSKVLDYGDSNVSVYIGSQSTNFIHQLYAVFDTSIIPQ